MTSPSSPAKPQSESHRLTDNPRNLLVPVDDSEECEHALQWAVDNVYRPGDHWILFHVLSPPQAAHSGLFLPTSAPHAFSVLELQAQHFIQQRFMPLLQPLQMECEVRIKAADAGADGECIGEHICIEAEDCSAALVVMAAHTKGRLLKYLLGSATKYCVNKCRQTVMVHHM